MIAQLASPSVCVIDDEPQDFGPILAALNDLYVSSVHLIGNDIAKLPPQPFKRLQLVFLDLHLTGAFGKAAASHTANVFMKVVSADTSPIVVVIWSKYAGDRVAEDGVPPEDEKTEAEYFKHTLLEAEPKYKGRLIFVEMPKPTQDGRAEDWGQTLKTEITNSLRDQSAVELLWAWDSLVKDAAVMVGAGLTSVATANAGAELKDSLKATLQLLTKAQGENDLSAATAPRHFVTVLAELLSDQIEHTDGGPTLAPHGNWLAAEPATALPAGFSAQMNGLLLTVGVAGGGKPFAPGTVYRFGNIDAFDTSFGKDCASLVEMLCSDGPNSEKRAAWRAAVKPVAIEVSPECDVAQNHRRTAALVAGLIVPATIKNSIKSSGDFFTKLPAVFRLRWPIEGYPEQDSILVFCHRYKASPPSEAEPDWLVPWFRLREMPTASLRNQQAGHSSRVGFVSVQG